MKIRLALVLTLLAAVALLVVASSPATIAQDSPLPVIRDTSPEAIRALLEAEGGQLLIYFPTGANFRQWLNNTLVPSFERHIKQTYDFDLQIGLLSTGGGDAAFWQRLQAFQSAGGAPGTFDIDVVRIAPDFRTLDAIEAGRFLPILPDYATIAPNVQEVNPDGLATFTLDGFSYAVPFFRPMVSIFYNSDEVENPPMTVEELGAWVAANPGLFTYEDPRSSSGIGSGTMFLMSVFNHFGDINDPTTWDEAWDFLAEMQPNLYPNPTTGEQALELMRRGEIHLMAFWNDWGLFSRETLEMPFLANYILESGMPIRNTPLAIPADAAHPVAALLFVDFALSPEMQASLGQVMRQIPGTISEAAWSQIPEDAFGFEYEYIVANTFAAFNSRENVDAIQLMAEGWSERILGR
jgi:putative spermidine/putrescine transport system substrate-binding protein